jgi:hypothetical protein
MENTNEHSGLHRYSDELLMREYLAMNKAGFDRMFGMNARRHGNACADALLARGITHVPNIFGPIEVKKWTY